MNQRRTLPPLPSDPPWGPRWFTDGGLTVLLEESHAIPLVDIDVVIKSGALHDPPGKEGLARLVARMLRMGTRRKSAEEIDNAIDAMGASLTADVGHGAIRLHGSVIKRSLPAFLELLGSLISSPALRASDLGTVRREAIADLATQRDNDRWLASRAFRKHLFGDHPYGRPTMGTPSSLERITTRDVERFVQAHVLASNLVVGVAGAITEPELRAMIDRAFGKLRQGQAIESALAVPSIAKGRRVLIVDKPQRTQTQLYVGTLGTRIADPLFYPLLVSNTAFGGTFTSRLVREVRSVRGWSYSAHSHLGADRQREAWMLYTHPSVENAVECAALEIELVESLIQEGLSATELGSARDYLTKSHAFDRDTSAKRLEPRLDAEIHGMPASFYTNYVDHVCGVTLPRAHEAIRARLSHEDLSIVLLASASEIVDRLKVLPKIRELTVVPFDRV